MTEPATTHRLFLILYSGAIRLGNDLPGDIVKVVRRSPSGVQLIRPAGWGGPRKTIRIDLAGDAEPLGS